MNTIRIGYSTSLKINFCNGWYILHGISPLYVRLIKSVPRSSLSAKGSKKDPANDAWLGNVLAIHPSSYMKKCMNYIKMWSKCESNKHTKSVIPATTNKLNAIE